jgi:hypothetical protein
MAFVSPPNPSRDGDRLPPEDERRRLQTILAEYHGLLAFIAHQIIPNLRADAARALAEQITRAYPGASAALGQVQHELNTGEHDEGIANVGLAAPEVDAKERGFRFHLRRLYSALKQTPTDAVRQAKHAARAIKWGNIILGSLGEEITKIRGMEVIREFGEVVAQLLEDGLAPRDEDDAGGAAEN